MTMKKRIFIMYKIKTRFKLIICHDQKWLISLKTFRKEKKQNILATISLILFLLYIWTNFSASSLVVISKIKVQTYALKNDKNISMISCLL